MQRFFWTWSKWPSSLKLPYTGYFNSFNYVHLRISKGTLGLHIGIKSDFWKWRAVTRKSHHCKIFPFLRFFVRKFVENRYWIEYKPLWCSGEAVGLSPQWSWVRLPAPGNSFCGCCRSCLYVKIFLFLLWAKNFPPKRDSNPRTLRYISRCFVTAPPRLSCGGTFFQTIVLV
jgi:hypothetical protein